MTSWPDWVLWTIFIAAVCGSFAISYGLALAGKPDALWVWRDVLGVL